MTDRSVLHLLLGAGAYSESWLDAQIATTSHYRSAAWRLAPEADPYRWQNRARHLRDVSSWAAAAVRIWESTRAGPVARRLSYLPGALAARAVGPPPDVLHAHYGPVAWRWLGLVRGWDIPLVVSFYGFDASMHEFHEPPWTSRYAQLFDRASAVLVEGPAMAQRLEALGCPASLLRIVRLPFSNVELSTSARQTAKLWDVIMAGRFIEKKGFGLGLEAVAEALPSDTQVLLVGEGHLEGELLKRAKDLGIADRVTLRRPVPLNELAELVAGSRVALFPSQTAPSGDGEGGAPLTLTLAQAVGTRVVITDHDDLPWAAAPGTPVVQEGNLTALAEALDETLADAVKQTASHLHHLARARNFVTREHDSQALAGQRAAIYDETQSLRGGKGSRDGERSQ